jgi:hypothetical protein
MMNIARQIRWIAVIGLVMPLAGCSPEHDEHEEESHFPPHWPKTFLVATDRLEQIAANANSTSSLAESIEQELTDLVDWLPELLADSDISKEEFDKIDAWAFPLSIEFKKSVQAGKKIDELLKNETLRQGLASLVELASQTRKRIADERAREEQEAADAKRQDEENAKATTPNPGNN